MVNPGGHSISPTQGLPAPQVAGIPPNTPYLLQSLKPLAHTVDLAAHNLVALADVGTALAPLEDNGKEPNRPAGKACKPEAQQDSTASGAAVAGLISAKVLDLLLVSLGTQEPRKEPRDASLAGEQNVAEEEATLLLVQGHPTQPHQPNPACHVAASHVVS